MSKTNSSFKLGKMVKLSMGSTVDKDARLAYKKAMIDAQHTYVINRNRKSKDIMSSKETTTS